MNNKKSYIKSIITYKLGIKILLLGLFFIALSYLSGCTYDESPKSSVVKAVYDTDYPDKLVEYANKHHAANSSTEASAIYLQLLLKEERKQTELLQKLLDKN